MSHDQKPGKVRVVGNAAAVPQRRRNDVVIDAPASPASPGAAGSPAAAAASRAGATAGGRQVLLAVLFVIGCAIGGAALPLLGILP